MPTPESLSMFLELFLFCMFLTLIEQISPFIPGVFYRALANSMNSSVYSPASSKTGYSQ